ncbi:hypothetical protein MNBD_ALPHA02-208 [hydrothermal vent metagenome]|uniref:ParD protein (Antitoxin to ParE) n=1 Tax=hydrothermal vent metagenome TaxID=652676 RepID=A0A3B0S446_9ZZZZ
MARNTSVIIGKHFSEFIEIKIEQGRFESTSEAVRAGLRLLENEKNKAVFFKKIWQRANQIISVHYKKQNEIDSR